MSGLYLKSVNKSRWHLWHQHMLLWGGCCTSVCPAPGPWHRCLSAHLTLGPQIVHRHHSSSSHSVWAAELCPLSHGWGCDSSHPHGVCRTAFPPAWHCQDFTSFHTQTWATPVWQRGHWCELSHGATSVLWAGNTAFSHKNFTVAFFACCSSLLCD